MFLWIGHDSDFLKDEFINHVLGFCFFVPFFFVVELIFLNVLLSFVGFWVLMTFLRFYSADSMHGARILGRHAQYIGIGNSDAQ